MQHTAPDTTPSPKGVADSFVKFYYQSLHENPAKLARLYSESAQLAHSKIPEDSGVNFISKNIEQHSFSTKKEIESFYANSKLADSKIRVSSIDFQTVFANSVLISVLGELALKDEVAVYRFTQSFIIQSTQGTTYDIVNDIFRLIPDEDYELNNADEETASELTYNEETGHTAPDGEKEQQNTSEEKDDESKKEKPAKKEETHATIVEEAQKEDEENVNETSLEGPKEESTPIPTSEEKTEAVVEEPSKIAKKAEETETTSVTDAPQEEPIQKANETGEEQKPTEEEKTAEEEKPAKVTTPGSWAQAASLSSGKPALIPKPKTVKPVKKLQTSTEAPHAPLSDVTNTQKPQSQDQRKKPSGEYPFLIRVKNTNMLKNDQIKKKLEKEFGRVLRSEPRGPWALVAFEAREAMDKALKMRTLRVGDVEVSMEKTELSFTAKKMPGQSNNGNGRSPSNKDKPQPQQQQQQQQKLQNRKRK